MKISERSDKNLKFVERGSNRTGTSRYVSFIEKVCNLTPGRAVVVKPMEGEQTAHLANRLSSAMRRLGATPPKGYTFRRRALGDGSVAVVLKSTKKKKKA